MISKASLALLVLLAGAASVPASFAAAADGSAASKAQQAKAQQAKAQKAKALRAKKAKQQQEQLALAKAKQEQQEKKWYEDDRDRGLDIAAEYAPKTIAKIRKKNYIAKGDTVKTGNGKTGWQHYMDKYYSR